MYVKSNVLLRGACWTNCPVWQVTDTWPLPDWLTDVVTSLKKKKTSQTCATRVSQVFVFTAVMVTSLTGQKLEIITVWSLLERRRWLWWVRSPAGTRSVQTYLGKQCIQGALSPEVNRPGSEVCQPPPSRTGIMNAWQHSCTFTHTCMACTVTDWRLTARPLVAMLVLTPPCGTGATVSSPIMLIRLMLKTPSRSFDGRKSDSVRRRVLNSFLQSSLWEPFKTPLRQT